MSSQFPFLFTRKGRVMPLVREENKKLLCRDCSKKKDEVSKYGWIFCNECDSRNQLLTVSKEVDIDALFDKHRDHVKPCCSAKKNLEELGLL